MPSCLILEGASWYQCWAFLQSLTAWTRIVCWSKWRWAGDGPSQSMCFACSGSHSPSWASPVTKFHAEKDIHLKLCWVTVYQNRWCWLRIAHGSNGWVKKALLGQSNICCRSLLCSLFPGQALFLPDLPPALGGLLKQLEHQRTNVKDWIYPASQGLTNYCKLHSSLPSIHPVRLLAPRIEWVSFYTRVNGDPFGTEI